MEPYYCSGGITIYCGDSQEVLQSLPAESVQCCVTSPPYWGLRDYGVKWQLGLESTPEQYVARLVEVFRGVRRVLRDDGTLWLNLGDSYNIAGRQYVFGMQIKPKDLIGIPWRVALALQADNWYLRSDIIWHKPNPMPENVTDRPTKAHEYLFLLTKSERYYYNAAAIAERAIYVGDKRHLRADTRKSIDPMCIDNGSRARTGNAVRETRNKRSVWTVTTQPFKGAHFATFPPKLIEPCILAGSRQGDIVLDHFAGAATTGLVSRQHARLFIGVELNCQYCEIAAKRLREVFGEK